MLSHLIECKSFFLHVAAMTSGCRAAVTSKVITELQNAMNAAKAVFFMSILQGRITVIRILR